MTKQRVESQLSGYRVFGSPRRYIQGPGSLKLLGSEVSALGERAAVICNKTVHVLLEEQVSSSLSAAAVSTDFIMFEEEVTREAVQRLCAHIDYISPDVVIALGGGKTVDAAKAAAAQLGIHLVIVPTLASNDAPTSRVVVFYDSDHHLLGVERYLWNPDIVLVDTLVIAQAPERFLVAGIGDALAKRFEADASARSERSNFHGGQVTLAGLSLASTSYDVLRRDGVEACRAVRNGCPNQSLEAVVEACILLAGLGFENSGIFLAHSLTRGLSLFPQTHLLLHGELVAYGLLVQLIQEERPPDYILDLLRFYRCIGLPGTLRDLGLDELSSDDLLRMAEATMAAPYMEGLGAQLSPKELINYIHHLEDISTRNNARPSATL